MGNNDCFDMALTAFNEMVNQGLANDKTYTAFVGAAINTNNVAAAEGALNSIIAATEGGSPAVIAALSDITAPVATDEANSLTSVLGL